MSAIVRKATGRPLDEFARTELFKPLGIADFTWRRVKGDTDARAGLRLRPRDMAKLNQLVLSGSRWNDHQIVSRGWSELSTAAKIKVTDNQLHGYLWWLGRTRAQKRQVDWMGALGRGGQSIRIIPERDLVVAVTAGYCQDYSAQAFKLQFASSGTCWKRFRHRNEPRSRTALRGKVFVDRTFSSGCHPF